MQSTIQFLPGSRVEFEITATEEQYNEYKKQAEQKLENEEDRSDTRLQYETIQAAAPQLYAICVSEHEVSPIAQASSVVLSQDPIRLRYSVDIFPKFELKLPEIEFEKKEHGVSDDELNAALESIKRDFGEFIEVEGEAKEGDRATINFDGSMDGQQHAELKGDDFPLHLGSKTFIPGFEDQIIGMSKDEEKSFKITFPENYQAKKFAGKEVEFAVKVVSVTRNQSAELNDDFVKRITQDKMSTIDELKNDIKEKITTRKGLDEMKSMELTIAKKLAEANDIQIPVTMMDAEKKFIADNLNAQLEKAGISREDHLKNTGMDEEKFEKELVNEALVRLRSRIALLEHAKESKIEIDESKIDKEKLKEATGSEAEFEGRLAAQKTELTLVAALEDLRNKYTK